MSGILGLVHFDGRPTDSRDLLPLARASAYRAVDGQAFWSGPGVVFAHQHFRVTPESAREVQPLAHGEVVVSYDGRLDNRAELAARCGAVDRVPDSASDAALVLAAYRTWGDDCAGRLEGDFAFALFDLGRRRLMLARDLMAARPLFYVTLPGGILFASDIKPLLAHPHVTARPDDDALADLLLNGHFDGERTWFDGIRSVPPGSVAIATADGIAIRRVSDLDDAPIRYRRWSDYAEHFGALFTQAVRRRLRSIYPVAVSVSGGVDSSSLQCEAARLGIVPVRGFTLAFPRGTAADEHLFVDALRRQGLDIEDIPVTDMRLVTDPERGVARSEMPRLPSERHDALLERVRDAGCRVMLEGFFGDQVLSGRAYLVDLALGGRWRVLRRHLRETPRWSDAPPQAVLRTLVGRTARTAAPSWCMQAARQLVGRRRTAGRYPPWFSPTFRERACQRALDRSREQRRRYANAHREQCWQNVRSGSYLSTILQTNAGAASYGVEIVYPYRDRELVSFLASVPGEVISRDGIPKALLREVMAGVVPDAIRLRRSKGDSTSLTNRAAERAYDVMAHRLTSASLAAHAGYLDVRVLQSHMNNGLRLRLRRDDSAEPGWQIADTLALELWLERFCGSTHAAVP